jgi:hypothetical protein
MMVTNPCVEDFLPKHKNIIKDRICLEDSLKTVSFTTMALALLLPPQL